MKRVFLLLLLLTSFAMLQAQNSWSDIGLSSDSVITSIVLDKNNNLYAGGRFINANGNYYIAKWDGNAWNELGPGKTGLLSDVIAVDSSGNVYSIAKDVNSPYYLTTWNGKNWKTLGAPNSSGVYSPIAVDKSQNVYAQAFNFDQTEAWFSPSINEGVVNRRLNAPFKTITIDNKGNVYAAGGFSSYKEPLTSNVITCSVLKNWNVFGSDVEIEGDISSIVVDALGDVYIASNGPAKKYVAKWDGTSWTELGSGSTALNATDAINSIAVDRYGNVYAAGSFVNGNGNRYVAKWDGFIWSELGADKDSLNANNIIYKIATDSIGNVYACGAFTNALGKKYIAKWTTNGITVSIKNTMNHPTIAIYPNPSTGIVYTNIQEAGRLSVYTILGKLITTNELNAGISSVDLSHVPIGMYTISFEGKSNTYIPVKFTKE